jgi:hypothetical protein
MRVFALFALKRVMFFNVNFMIHGFNLILSRRSHARTEQYRRHGRDGRQVCGSFLAFFIWRG